MQKFENKAILKVMIEKGEEALAELKNYLNRMFRLVLGFKTDSKVVEGGRYIRGSDG